MIGRDHSRLRGKVALVPANSAIRAMTRAREGSQATHPGHTLSVLLNVVVHPADIQNRDGCCAGRYDCSRSIERIFANGAYAGAAEMACSASDAPSSFPI
jgi:hypothetical protein